MKFLVTGAAGQLGYDVMRELKRRGYEAVGSDIENARSVISCEERCRTEHKAAELDVPVDIKDAACVERVLEKIRPDVLIHCAAWTNVDAAEELVNQEKVWNINVEGTKNLALACHNINAKMVYISTDYVFDGQGSLPWKTDRMEYAPQNFYGKTKLEGERAVVSILTDYFIVRTSWVFGENGNNFVKTMLRLGKQYNDLRVVSDQIGTPTYTRDLARLLVDMAETDKYGCYHATNEGGYISWYEFAREIFQQAAELGYRGDTEKLPEVYPVTTEEYGNAKATRPFNSRLDRSKLGTAGFQPLPDWKDALHRYLQELGEEGWDR